MKVVNDRTPKAKTPELDPFHLVLLAFFAAAAFSTFILAPLPLLLANWRLPEPASKAVALLGAALAVLVLDAPVPWVAVAFSIALVFSDQIDRERPVWGALGLSVFVALMVAFGVFLFQARLYQAQPMAYWQETIHSLVSEVRTLLKGQPGFDLDTLERVLYQQAPFLLASITLVSCWISLGAAAHLGWLNPNKKLSSRTMRATLQIPPWVSLSATFLMLTALVTPLPFYGAGLVRFLSAVLFTQGSLCLSDILSRRRVMKTRRTWIYALLVVFGFYALLALGMISPWYFRAARKAGPVKEEAPE